jgi:hypothetical protein
MILSGERKHEKPRDVSDGVDNPGQQAFLDGAALFILATVTHNVKQARDDILVGPLRLFPPIN